MHFPPFFHPLSFSPNMLFGHIFAEKYTPLIINYVLGSL